MKLAELTSRERATYRTFIDGQLEKGMALAAIRHLLEKKGVDPELARELVKVEAFKHASANMQKAYLSLGIGVVLTCYLLYQGLTDVKILGMHPFAYGIGTLATGVFGYVVFHKRYRYLKNLD